MKKIVLLFVLAATMCVASPLTCVPVLAVPGITGCDGSLPNVQGNLPVANGFSIIANGGDVSIAFAGFSSADTDEISFDGGALFFPNKTTPLGSVMDLGNFAAGTVLQFSLHNENTGQTFYSGPAALNPDDAVHAAYAAWTATSAIPFNGLFVGFEDLSNFDNDYQDLGGVVSGVHTSCATPEPAGVTLAGIGLGLIGIASIRRRRKVVTMQ